MNIIFKEDSYIKLLCVGFSVDMYKNVFMCPSVNIELLNDPLRFVASN